VLVLLGLPALLAGCGTQSESESDTAENSQQASAERSTPGDRSGSDANSGPQRNNQAGNENPPDRQGVFVNPQSVDFGVVKPNSVHEANFTIYNNTNSDVRIIEARPTCKCTTMNEVSGQVIAPGEQLNLPASMELTARPGSKTARVDIVYEMRGQSSVTRASLQAEVQLAVRAQPPFVDALQGKKSGVLTVESVDGRPFNILSSNGQPPKFVNYDPQSDTPRSSYQVRWQVPDWPVRPPCEEARLWWIIETDHPEAPILPCRIRHECTGVQSDPNRQQRGWIFYELIVNAEKIPPGGEPTELTLQLLNEDQVPITGVRSLSDDVDVEMLGSSHDELRKVTNVNIRLTPDPDFRGMLFAPVEVQSQTGNHHVDVVASVRP